MALYKAFHEAPKRNKFFLFRIDPSSEWGNCFDRDASSESVSPVSILHKSIAGHYRPVRVADGPIMARYRFM